MFSSNQRFDITCTFDGLAEVINFAVKLSGCGEMFTRSTNRVMPAWQITSTGKYCLGRGSMTPGGIHPAGLKTPDGWTDYPFDYNPKIIAEIVQQWVEKQPEPEAPYTDGSSSRLGVRVMCKESMDDIPDALYNGITNPWPAVIVFVAYIMTYDK